MGKKGEKKGKKPHKNKESSKKYNMYKIEGDSITRQSFCPRCGAGVFLARTKDRIHCGKCHYTEFLSSNKK